jgi:light-regulated signal transduction histidine kinase (bacteriophytochrome)
MSRDICDSGLWLSVTDSLTVSAGRSEQGFMSQLADDRHVSRELIIRALHDLQAPARHVRSFLSLFQESIDDSLLSSDSIELLEAASRAGDELRNRILAIRSVLAVPTTIGTATDVDLAIAIQAAWREVCEKRPNFDSSDEDRAQLVIDGNAVIESDERLVVDLIAELLDNSLCFKKSEERLLIRVQLSHGQDEACVEVSDNGIGIQPDRIEWSMQPFHCGQHHDGYGLGLARCKCIAAAIGCQLSLRSDGSTGTTAVLQFRSKHHQAV